MRLTKRNLVLLYQRFVKKKDIPKRNWPYIVRAGRIWSCLSVALYPMITIAMNHINGDLWLHIELCVFLVLLLGGLFIPIYVVGRKYE